MCDSCGQLGHLQSVEMYIRVACTVKFPAVDGNWGETRDMMQAVGQEGYLAWSTG